MVREGRLVKNRVKYMLALSVLIAPVIFFMNVAADVLGQRSISISTASPSATNVTYVVDFTPTTPASYGSFRLEFCNNSPLSLDPCNPTPGLDVSAANLINESGNTGFSINSTTANEILLTRSASAAIPVLSSYELSGIVNPSNVNETTYVRISLYGTTDGSGAAFDEGAVAFSTTPEFNVGLFVPPYMTFCVGQTVSIDCSSIAANFVDFGEFSAGSAAAATTQFSVSTNDPTGYNTFISGQTMTSGTNIIPSLTTQTSSVAGASQFGVNLRANTSPLVGSDPDGVGSGGVDALYSSPNLFRFVSGDRVAGSGITTDFNRYTVSYIVNVTPDQAPGIYASTLTYTSVASF